MADRRSHLPHLPVAPLRESQLKPSCWNILPESDRDIAGRDRRIPGKEFHGSSPGLSAFDDNSGSQFLQRILCRDAFNLNQIRPRMGEAGFQEKVFGLTVVREEEEPFAVRIEPADWINVAGKRTEILKSSASWFTGELAQNPVRLVEKEIGELLRGWSFSCPDHSDTSKKIPRRDRRILNNCEVSID
jgi:hypothetical protein